MGYSCLPYNRIQVPACPSIPVVPALPRPLLPEPRQALLLVVGDDAVARVRERAGRPEEQNKEEEEEGEPRRKRAGHGWKGKRRS